MPFSSPSPRTLLHKRDYQFTGYRREDGLWDIEGRMTDRKTYAFPNDDRGQIAADEPFHDMRIRLTIDDALIVRAIELETAAAPFSICPNILPNYQAVVGMSVGKGWRRRLQQTVGGIQGCTHQMELLAAMATVAYQTVFGERNRQQRAGQSESAMTAGKNPSSPQTPMLLNTCHTFAEDSPIVERYWPESYRPKPIMLSQMVKKEGA